MKKIIIVAAGLVCMMIACRKSKDISTTITCSGTQSFTSDVYPIIQSFCAISGCHASGSINGPGAFTTYQQVFTNRAAVRAAVISGSMPQNTRLSASQRSAIVCWIDNGAANN